MSRVAVTPGAPASPGGTRQAVARPPEVLLRPLGGDGGPARIRPGDLAVFEVLVSGGAGLVLPGRFALRAEGLPAGAARFSVAEVQTGRRRPATRVRLEVRLPEHLARPGSRVPFAVLAVPVRGRSGAGRAAGAVDVDAGSRLRLETPSPVLDGRRGVRTDLVVANQGTLPVRAHLVVADEPGLVRTQLTPAHIHLAPGGSAVVALELVPRRARLSGRSRTHELAVLAFEPDGRRTDGRSLTFVQRPVVPWKAVVAALALVAGIALAVVLASRPEQVVAPRLVGLEDLAAAEQVSEAAGLQLSDGFETAPAGDLAPGTVLDQLPAPGRPLARGESLKVVIAVGQATAPVPRLAGLPVQELREAVTDPGLSLAEPLAADGVSASEVVGQLPLPGRRVPLGTPVRATLGPAGGVTGGAEPARVPAVAGSALTRSLRALAAAGLAPKVQRQISPGSTGRVLGTDPARGAVLPRGAQVFLRVSAGVPRLAYGTPNGVRVLDPAQGRTVLSATAPLHTATEPSWSSDGRRLVYRTGRRLVIAQPGDAVSGRTLYGGKAQYQVATLAPARDRDVLAMIRRRGDDGDLCFAKVETGAVQPRCLPDDGWDLGRQAAWSPNGRSLLVFGVRKSDPTRFGILRFDTRRPYATDPSAWRGELVTDGSRARHGVIAAAWSPDGSRVALASNVASERFQLVVTSPATLFQPRELPLPVRACQVAWRPDGHELAVVAGDDTCSAKFGTVSRVPLERPREASVVTLTGRLPSYQPLTYAPGADGR